MPGLDIPLAEATLWPYSTVPLRRPAKSLISLLQRELAAVSEPERACLSELSDAAIGALASLERLLGPEGLPALPAKIERLSRQLGRLREIGIVGEIRQKGLMAGIELVQDRPTRQPFPPEKRIGQRVCREARERGVLLRPLGDVIVVMPPLNSRERKMGSDTIGCSVRDSMRRKAARPAAATPNAARMRAEVQPMSWPSIRA